MAEDFTSLALQAGLAPVTDVLAKPLQINLVEIRRLDARTPGCDIPCKAEKMLNL